MELAGESIRRSVERSDRAGNVAIYGAARFLVGWHAFYVGEWNAARLGFERTTEALEGTAYTIQAYAPFAKGLIPSVTGAVEAGREALREAIALSQQTGFLFGLHRAHRELAEVELVLGLADDVRQRLEPLVESPGSEQYNDITPLLPMLAWAYLEAGQDARAQILLAQGFQRATYQHHQLALIDLWRIQGLRCIKQQRWQEAEAALEASLVLARAMPFPYAEAKAHYLLGKLHALSGEPDDLAREAYEQALAICTRLGERLYAERIEQALLALEGGA
jgi:tetratricopeptide (TPR) repeat protein